MVRITFRCGYAVTLATALTFGVFAYGTHYGKTHPHSKFVNAASVSIGEGVDWLVAKAYGAIADKSPENTIGAIATPKYKSQKSPKKVGYQR